MHLKTVVYSHKAVPVLFLSGVFLLCSSPVRHFGRSETSLLQIPAPQDKVWIFWIHLHAEKIDVWGVAHEPGGAAAKHMTRMRHPLCQVEDLEEIKAYPFPDFSGQDSSCQRTQTEDIHRQGLAAVGCMQVTIWETTLECSTQR